VPETVNYTVLIPARLASTRLPDKPLADIAGKPMVVRVAERASLAGAQRVVVAADDARIVAACAAHGVHAVLTSQRHPSGSDRLAQACELLGLDGDDAVVNVQGDELLLERLDCVMSTVAHPISELGEFINPNVVKVVLDAQGRALYFTRATVPWWRDGNAAAGVQTLPTPAPLRHLGLYGYRAGFLRSFPQMQPAPLEQCEALEQLRVLWHGERIAVHVTTHASGPGVDTPEDLARVRALFTQGKLSA